MHMRCSKIIALAMTACLLGGCQSIFAGSRTAKAEQWVPEERNPAEFAASQLAMGREALEYQQYGRAITSFRNARLVPEHAAEAYNGMAIAYSQIGRPDLAERFFKQAIAEAPGDKRFYANLARFYQMTAASAVRTTRDEMLAAAEATAARFLPGSGGRAAIRIELPASRMTRVSANEVRIATPAAPVDNDPRRPSAQALASSTPTAARRRNPAYPLRISLPDTQTAQAPASEVHIVTSSPAASDPRRRVAARPAGSAYPASGGVASKD